jgi:hypothetical protein
MLEFVSYGLTGLVAILLFAFCFACKNHSASLSDKHLSRSADYAELSDTKGIGECTCVADSGAGPTGQKHEGALNG